MSPKSAEISQLTVMKGSEEKPQESMLIQSAVNIQLDTLRKGMTATEIPVEWILIPDWFLCYGILP